MVKELDLLNENLLLGEWVEVLAGLELVDQRVWDVDERLDVVVSGEVFEDCTEVVEMTSGSLLREGDGEGLLFFEKL